MADRMTFRQEIQNWVPAMIRLQISSEFVTIIQKTKPPSSYWWLFFLVYNKVWENEKKKAIG